MEVLADFACDWPSDFLKKLSLGETDKLFSYLFNAMFSDSYELDAEVGMWHEVNIQE